MQRSNNVNMETRRYSPAIQKMFWFIVLSTPINANSVASDIYSIVWYVANEAWKLQETSNLEALAAGFDVAGSYVRARSSCINISASHGRR